MVGGQKVASGRGRIVAARPSVVPPAPSASRAMAVPQQPKPRASVRNPSARSSGMARYAASPPSAIASSRMASRPRSLPRFVFDGSISTSSSAVFFLLVGFRPGASMRRRRACGTIQSQVDRAVVRMQGDRLDAEPGRFEMQQTQHRSRGRRIVSHQGVDGRLGPLFMPQGQPEGTAFLVPDDSTVFLTNLIE